MLGLLIKKQLWEINAGFFMNRKKGTRKTKMSTILTFIGFGFLIVVVLGGMLFMLANLLCTPFCSVGLDWLYFALIGIVSIALGVFGSVFNTYASLFQAKDNELLLSLPIPAKTIIQSRLVTVYLMGLFYSAIVLIPSILVYYFQVNFSLGSLVFLFDISLINLFLSCLLGYGVAQIAKRTKGKSYITVIISLLFIALYYYVYFMAMGSIKEIVANPQLLASSMEGWVPIILFGKVGQGDLVSMALVTFLSGILCYVVYNMLSKSFFTLSQKGTETSKKKKVSKEVVQKSVFHALLQKEFGRFTNSANYMLNCGLGSVFLLIIGFAILIKGNEIFPMVREVFEIEDIETIIFIIGCFGALAMVDTTAPSISLEGKNFWILRSLPIDTWKILLAKLHVHWVITSIPLVFSWICFLIVGKPSVFMAVVSLISSFGFILFTSCLGLMINCLKVNLNWVDEIVVIKQSFSVFVSMMLPMVIVMAFAGGYFIKGYTFTTLYVCGFMIILLVISLTIFFWLKKKGTQLFEQL